MATQVLISEDDEALGDQSVEPTITPTDDGGAVVDFTEQPEPDPSQALQQAPWDANLAEYLDDTALGRIGSEVCDAVKADDASREEWKKANKDGMDLLGFISTPRSTPFEGACGVVYPMITEAAIKFQARAFVEMCPDGGPVDTVILGAETKETRDQSERVRDFMNWYLTEQDESYYADYDQMLLWLPILGSVFRKVWWDPSEERVTSRYVHPDDLIVSYGASDIDTAPRITQELRYTGNELKKLQIAGMYRDTALVPVTQHADPGPLSEKADEIEGVVPTTDDPSARRKLFEVHTELDIEADPVERPEGLKLPYVVTIDEETQAVLAIRRNWRQQDQKFKRRKFFVHYRYLPGLGCYGYGLLHVAGGLARAATSMLRQLVDAGQFANLPAGIKAKGAIRADQNNLPFGPGEWREVDNVDPSRPIANMLSALPYKEPSATLFQLMNGVIESGQRLTSTTDAEVGDGSTQQPVGTVLALIENATQVQSAVHKRSHQTQRREFRLMSDLFGEHAPQEGYPFNVVGGQRKVMAQDFDAKIDVVPISDPKSFTATQRIAKAQFALQTATTAPQLHNAKELYKYVYQTAGIDAADGFMAPDPPKPYTADPNSENLAAMSGKPLAVRPDQDHAAHCTAHLLMLQIPGMMMSPAGQTIFRHAVEHELNGIWQREAQEIAQIDQANPAKQQARALGAQVPPLQLPPPGQPMDPALENAYAQKAAQAMSAVVAKIKAMVPMPPGQTDPAMIQAQTNIEDVHLRDQREREKIRLDAEAKARDSAQKAAEHNDTVALEYEKLTADVTSEQMALEQAAREGVMDRIASVAIRPQPQPMGGPQA